MLHDFNLNKLYLIYFCETYFDNNINAKESLSYKGHA